MSAGWQARSRQIALIATGEHERWTCVPGEEDVHPHAPASFRESGRDICPSCNASHLCEVAAHLRDHVPPHLPARQWVLSVL